MKHKQNAFAESQATPKKSRKTKESRAERHARQKAERRALLPIHKRPIVCPPDRVGRHPLFRFGGLLARALVIWLAASGLMIFISDALELGVPRPVILLTALVTVVLCAVFSHSGLGRLIAGICGGGAAAALVVTSPRLIPDIPYSFLALYNAALTRLHKVGYLTYAQYKVNVAGFTSTSESELVVIGVGILTVLIAGIFAVCLYKRVRIVLPAILASSLLVVILTFNIYSNCIASNLGIALIIVAFASILVMAAYDRLYRQKDSRRYDTELQLFEDTDRPTLPADYAEKQATRSARRKARAELHAKRRSHTVTVEDELTDYFSTDRKAKGHKASADRATRRAERTAHRNTMREVRAVRCYDRVTAEARTAMGGYAAAAVLVICLLAVSLPALFVKGNFNTIDAIDEKMALARDYVTALLRGDDDRLDRLEYGADKENFQPHSTELEQLEFNGTQIFYIQSRYNTNFYLRGWIGTEYRDGAWLAVSDEVLDAYHDRFGEDISPSEEMRYNFYHYIKPELVDDPAYNDNLLTKYQSNTEYGFVMAMVGLRRVNSPSTLAYFPASMATRFGLYDYGTTNPSKLSFVNFYDGLYTGRKLHENGISYATVAYAPVMTSSYWASNQADLQAIYNLQREALLATYPIHEDGSRSGTLTLEVIEQGNGMSLFRYTFKQGQTQTVWRFNHATDRVRYNRSEKQYIVSTDFGYLTIFMDGSRVERAELDPTHQKAEITTADLLYEYDRGMTDAERAKLMEDMRLELAYSSFVYGIDSAADLPDIYTNTSDSRRIKELAATIRDQAHIEQIVKVEEVIPDDPETPEDDSYTVTHRVTENIPVDVSLAAVPNSSDPAVYVQRDRLVRNVIDYIINEMGCAYTITPDLTNVDAGLDGVENFLFNTKQGYCVQFASATALILRELGVPARYAEGYIANGLGKTGTEFVYGTYVRDYQAHAWVEVYFDGLGWIQYETTPQYYAGMYGSANTTGSRPVDPVLPNVETGVVDNPIVAPETDPLDTLPEDTETETGSEDDRTAAAVTRASLISLGVLAAIAAVAILFYNIIARARAAEDHRQSIVAQVLESGFGTNTSDGDRREMALELTDAVMDLLGYYDLSPKPGEFREDYAARVEAELQAPLEGKPVRADEARDLSVLRPALEGMAAEEFGHGMSIVEMKAVAALYPELRRDLRRRIGWTTRMKLRYVKHKI